MFYHGTLLSFCSFHIPFNVDKLSCLRIHELCVKMCTWRHVHIGRPPDAMCPMFGHTRRLGGEQLVSHVWNVNWPPSPISPPLPRMSRRNAVRSVIAVVAWRRIICIAAHCGYSMARDIAGFIECHFDEQWTVLNIDPEMSSGGVMCYGTNYEDNSTKFVNIWIL